MSINTIINSGLSALLANQSALRTTSSNIANVNTPDYVRRITNFETQIMGGVLGGVDTAAVTRAVDGFLAAQRWAARSAEGETGAADRFLDQLQRSMGGVADKRDPVSRLAATTAGLAELAADPNSAARRADLLGRLRDFAQGMTDLGAKTQELRNQADQEIGDTVNRINELVRHIAELNTPIQQATVRGDLSTGLRDQRDAAIRELSGLIEIQVDESSSGRVTVATPTGQMLVSTNIAEITHQSFSAGSAEAIYPPMQIVMRNPSTGEAVGVSEPLERHVWGGKLRGLLDQRDKTLPDIAMQTGALAAGTVEAYNAAHNASTTYPAPATLAGRDTGLLATDAHGFTGRTTIAVVDNTGALVRRIDVDFSLGQLSVNGGAAAPIGTTIGSMVTAINTALGGVGSANFTDGKLTLNASGGTNGIAVQQDPTQPSSRAGRGFAHAFGLNDLLVSSAPTSFATGLQATDGHGFTAGDEVSFQLRNPDGSIGRSFTYTVGGATIGDMVTGLNAAAAGAGTFTLDGQGRISFAPSVAGQRLEQTGDETLRGGTSLSMSAMFGLGQRFQMEQANISLRADMSPTKLALAQLDLTPSSAVGAIVLASADNKGVLALQSAGNAVAFPPAGGLTASTQSLSQFASALVASIGQKSAAATSAAEDALAFKGEIEERAAQKEGVNLDEELANMMVYQQAYNAGARLITTAQQLYDALLSMMR